MQDSVKQDREKYIGGSDIPVIMSLSPYKTRYDLLLEKAGYKEADFEGNIYTDYGNALEPVIRDYINGLEVTNEPYLEGKHVREAEAGEIIGARIHTDGENKDAILEIKTTGAISESVYDYKLYLPQLVYYMVLTGKQYGLLAVYERPSDLNTEFDSTRLHLYRITRGDSKIESLVADVNEAIERFIEDLAKVKANPFITESELLPSEIPSITKEILALEYQLESAKQAEKRLKDLKANLKTAMVNFGVKTWQTPNGYKITLVDDIPDKAETKTELNEVALKRDLPELFKAESEGGYMVTKPVIKKGRAGYILITPPREKEG